MAEFIGACVALFVVFGLPNLIGSGNNNNQRFGENRYDFKDYVNNKVDKNR